LTLRTNVSVRERVKRRARYWMSALPSRLSAVLFSSVRRAKNSARVEPASVTTQGSSMNSRRSLGLMAVRKSLSGLVELRRTLSSYSSDTVRDGMRVRR